MKKYNTKVIFRFKHNAIVLINTYWQYSFVANIWQTFLGYIFNGESGNLRVSRIQIRHSITYQQASYHLEFHQVKSCKNKAFTGTPPFCRSHEKPHSRYLGCGFLLVPHWLTYLVDISPGSDSLPKVYPRR